MTSPLVPPIGAFLSARGLIGYNVSFSPADLLRPVMRGLSSIDTRSAMIVGFWLALIVLVAGGVLGFVNAGRLADNSQLVSHTYDVVGQLEQVLSLLKDAETGHRGYVLVEDPAYLEPYNQAVAGFDSKFAELRRTIADNAEQQQRLVELQEKASRRLAQLRQGVALTQQGQQDASVEFIKTGGGKALMDEIRADVATMQQVEYGLLEQRAREAEQSYRTTITSIGVATLMGMSLVGLVFFLSRRHDQEQQRAAEIVFEQRERLRTTLASIGDAVISADPQGCVTYLNSVAEQLTGWSNAEAQGLPLTQVFNIVNEDSRQPVENPALRAIADGVIVGLANHTILISKDGSERPIDDSAAPIRCQDGQIVGSVLVFRDVTEARHTTRRLRDAEELFRALADSIPQLAWMTRPDGFITWYNQRWYEYTGTTPEQTEGWGWEIVHDPAHLPRVIERFKSSIESGEAWEDTFPLRRKDGEFRWHLSRALPIRDQQGQIVRWVGTNTDITERLQLEEDLRRLAADLSEAARRKDEFLATLSHELRNPLAPIRTGLEILKLVQNDPEKMEEIRATMERQVQQMVRLIDDLLDVSRITQGKLELRTSQVALSEVIRSAIEATRPLIDEAGHELIVELPAEPVVLHADPNRLAQVFANLLNNSTKYTPERGRIWLGVEHRDGEVTVIVRDNGLGIPPEMQESIFEMFAQIDRPIEQRHKGLGIGLTLVKRLVHMHGGRIEVNSQGHDLGSEFRVHLPLQAVALPPQQLPLPAGIAGRSGQQLKVLVVDDNVDAATMLSLSVRTAGHEVRTAHDGIQAVEIAAEFQPHVVLMDLGMPRMNGYEAARQIRQQPWGLELVLIALTGWGQNEDKQRSKEAGFDHHLVKPIEPTALQMLLAQFQSRDS